MYDKLKFKNLLLQLKKLEVEFHSEYNDVRSSISITFPLYSSLFTIICILSRIKVYDIL